MDWTNQIAQYIFPSGAKPNADVSGLIQALGDACQGAVEREIGRTFDVVPYYDIFDGDGRTVLYLPHDPIQSLTSLTIDGAVFTVQSSLYSPANLPTWPLPQCIIKRGNSAIMLTDGSAFSVGIQNVGVGYTAGLADSGGSVPNDLAFAIVYWAGLLFKDRDKLGIANVNAGQQLTSFTHNIPSDVRSMIAGWRRTFK
jgi:hypothetical protein